MIDRGTNVATKTTQNINTAGVPIDMEARTRLYKPKNYTTRALVSKFGSSIAAKDMTHKYRERRPMANWTTIAVADAVGQAHIEVTDYSIIKNDCVLWIIRDGERIMQLLVQDADIDATVSVVMFTGATGSGTLTSATVVGDIVVVGPEAHSEGEAVPAAYSNISITQEDTLMQSDRAVKKTDIEANTGKYDESEKKLAQDMIVAWIEENSKINLLMYWGEAAAETTSGSGKRYSFKGLIDRITENVDDYSGVGAGYTVQALQESIRKTQDNTPADGIAFLMAGVNLNNAVSSWADGAIRVDPNSKKWGIQVRIVQTQYGEIGVLYDNVLQARYGLEDRGFILNSAHMRMMHLEGLPMKAYYNITDTRDIHNMEHAISGTTGIQMGLNEAFAQMKGIN